MEESFPVEEKKNKQAKGEENKPKVEEIRRKTDGKLWSDQIGAWGSMTLAPSQKIALLPIAPKFGTKEASRFSQSLAKFHAI